MFSLVLIFLYLYPVLLYFNKAARLIFMAKDVYLEELKNLRYKILEKERFNIEPSETYKNLTFIINSIED